MEEKIKKANNQQSEIDIKELVLTLWKSKMLIISIALITAFIAAIISVFVISPVYNTKLNIVISMPEVYVTRYGEYILPITTNEQYISLITSNDVIINTIKDMDYEEEVTIEDTKARINIKSYDTKTNIKNNNFEVAVSANNPVESLKLAQTLNDNYMEFLDVMIKERAINYYINNFNVENKSLENRIIKLTDTLKKNEELLKEIPKFIENSQSNIEIHTKLNENSDYVVPVHTANPNYISIEKDIVANRQAIYDSENTIKMNSQYLKELDLEMLAIKAYYETGRAEKLESSVISVVETNIYMPSQPVQPSKKTSPSNSMNTMAGAVIGGVIGIMAALIKEYWFTKEVWLEEEKCQMQRKQQ